MPISATFSVGTAVVVVTFDRPLVPGVLNALNWSGSGPPIAALGWGSIGPVVAAGSAVTIPTIAGAPDPPALRVSYSAVTPDVLNLDAVPAAPFVDFPVVSIP